MTGNQKVVVENLPYLRRYARAILGDQTSADALVLAVVNMLALGNPTSPRAITRLDMFKRLNALLHGPVGEHILSLAPRLNTGNRIEKRLSALASLPREAFLLKAVEGFSEDQIAEILGIKPSESTEALMIARRELFNQVSTDVLIIEDEMFIASELMDIATSLGHKVCAVERTHRDAVRSIEESKPGLILADIQLADGSSGIDAVNDILLQVEVPVIFITAYPERLLTGLRPEPTFVLTKPFKDEAVRAVINEALFFETRARRHDAPARSKVDLLSNAL